VLVTAGGTREAIDSVRFIGNRSSGRMGVALAEAAARRGADVTLIAANVSLPISPRVGVVRVESAAELAKASRAAFGHSDVLLMAAAVADFRPETAEGKLVREGSGGMELRLTETEDVVASLARERRPEQTLVGFAAEHGADAISRAREKLERKGLDAIVFNDISRPEIGFDSPRNEVTIVTAGGERAVPESTKEEVAEAVLDEVDSLRGFVHSKRDD
jgi:phosphopantothenoylcysteine decarboxylase/phosphopantothenate--cysteine ligase